MRDMHGEEIKKGDYIIYGSDNGSSLFIGKVFKLGNKRCWFNRVHQPEVGVFEVWENNIHNRYYDRVSIYKRNI
ncbi:hypothetical protein 65p437 [Aeromonas phage 65]|uniref:Uncharacterized protein n=2 Tax=Ishigurovirus osborne TaxID=260149 RepID=A0A219YCT0_9CAUD|nr:hypothetical protein ST65p437 [Aeromonas phage 65]ADQ53443.1 hypothetical protein 65p437 [Aeromonas phage 65]APU01799.1 hypothetical protein [Aeromonas phage 65.2]